MCKAFALANCWLYLEFNVDDLDSLGYAMHVNMYQTKISLYIKNLLIILVLNELSCLGFEFVSFRCARSLINIVLLRMMSAVGT